MALQCPGCGRQYDVTLFEFGRTVRCHCGRTIGLGGGHQLETVHPPEKGASKMNAAVIHGPGDLRIEEVPRPTCGHDEVLLRVKRACICNACEIGIYRGTTPHILKFAGGYPHIMGHECCGEIIEVGRNAGTYKVGQRIGYWCKMNGAFAEYNAVDIHQAIAVLDDRVSDEAGAILELAGGGTMRAIDRAGIRPGEIVAVLGLGPAGLCLIQHARNVGAGAVIGIELLENRRQKALELGADQVFDPTGRSVAETAEIVLSQFGRVDVVFDAVGEDKSPDQSVTTLGILLLPKGMGGRYVMFGHPFQPRPVPLQEISFRGIALLGFSQSRERTTELIRFAARQVAEGCLNLEALVTHRLPLGSVEEGIQLVEEHPNEAIKVILEIGD